MKNKRKWKTMRSNAMKVIFVSALLCIGMSFMQCRHFAMTKTDNIRVINKSPYKMDIFINYGSFETEFVGSESNSYINPNSKSGIMQVNKSWDSVLSKYGRVTLVFVEWLPHFDEKHGHGSQEVYGYLYLTKTKLDSLDGVITFPDDAIPN